MRLSQKEVRGIISNARLSPREERNKWLADSFNLLMPEKEKSKIPWCPHCLGKGVIAARIEQHGNYYVVVRRCQCVEVEVIQ